MGKKLIDFLEDIGFEILLFIAGVMGAISNTANQKLPKWQRIFAFFSGGAIAVYLGPIIYIYFNVNENAKYGIGYLLGFSGIEGVKFILVKARELINKNKTDDSN